MMRRAALALAAALTIALPASAEAAALALAPVKACYRTGETVSLSGSAFSPAANASVAIDGQALGTVPTDAAGNLATPLTFGRFSGVGQHAVTATDSANAANVGSVAFTASAVTVRVRPESGRPGRRLRIRATGFTTGKRLWAHILRPGFRRNVRVGRLRGPCRRGNVRRRIFNPDAASGRYTVQFDTKRRYSRRTTVRVRFRVRVRRASGAASAAAAAWRRID